MITQKIKSTLNGIQRTHTVQSKNLTDLFSLLKRKYHMISTMHNDMIKKYHIIPGYPAAGGSIFFFTCTFFIIY